MFSCVLVQPSDLICFQEIQRVEEQAEDKSKSGTLHKAMARQCH